MLLGITDVTPYLVRLCLDSIPYSRIELLSELVRGEVSSTHKSYYDLDDLKLLGICDQTENGYSLKQDIKWLVEALLARR